MITIGVDYHKRTSSYYVMDKNGKKMTNCKLENTQDNIQTFLQELEGPKQLAMEATRNWGIFHDCVKDLVDDFYLGHPKKMKAITESETKNDKKDAELICRLLKSNFLPQAHVSCLNTRQLRSLVRFRHFLVTQRKSIRNQVQTLIDRNLWVSERPKSFKNLFCKKGLLWLQQVTLAQRERFILNQCIENFHQLTSQIDQLETYITEQSIDIPGLKYLRSVPGFKYSKVNIYIVLLEADDMARFRKARGFAHYAGLIPREYSSGDKHRNGRLVKGANKFLRTALIESTFGAIRSDRGLRSYYKTVKARSGSSAAVIATARKLSYAIYHVLKEQRRYYPETAILQRPPIGLTLSLS